MKHLIAAALSAASLAALADPDARWVKSGETKTEETYIQRGSFEETNFEGEPAASVISLSRSIPEHVSTTSKLIVTRKGCTDGVGRLYVTTLAGELKKTVEFAFGARDLGSFQAEMICAGYGPPDAAKR